MSLVPVPDDQHGLKTCLQVYNPAGFSMEFAALRLRTFNSRLVRGAAPPPNIKTPDFIAGVFCWMRQIVLLNRG